MQAKMQPIFEPLRGKYKPFGIPMSKVFGILGVLALGIVLSFLLDLWQHEVDIAYTPIERNTIYQEYQSLATTMASLEAQRDADGAFTFESMNLTPLQLSSISTARELGITGDSTSEYLQSIVPVSHRGYQPVIHWIVRIVFLIVLPFVAGVVLFIEPEGMRTSAWREFKRMHKFAKSQKVYKSLPMTYVERSTGVPYFEALSRIKHEGRR